MAYHVNTENGYSFQNYPAWQPNNKNRSNNQEDLNRSLYRAQNKEDFYIKGYSDYDKAFMTSDEVKQYHSYGDSRFGFKIDRTTESSVYLKPQKGDKLRTYSILDPKNTRIELENTLTNNNGDVIKYIISFYNVRVENKSGSWEDRINGDYLKLNHLDQLKEGIIFDGQQVINKDQGDKSFPVLGLLNDTEKPVYVKVAVFLNDSDRKIGLDSVYQYIDPLLFLGYYDPQRYERGVLVANRTNDFITYYINDIYPNEKEQKKASDFLTQFLMFGPSKGAPILPTDGLEEPEPEPIPIPEAVPVSSDDSLPEPVQDDEPEPEPLDSGDSLPEPADDEPTPTPIVIKPRPTPTVTQATTNNNPCPTLLDIINKIVEKFQPWLDWQKERFKDVNDALNNLMQAFDNRISLLTEKINQIKIDCPSPCPDNEAEIKQIQEDIKQINEAIRDIVQNAKPQLPSEAVQKPEPETIPEVTPETKQDEKGFFASIWEYFKNPSLWSAILLFLLLLGLLFTAMAVKNKIRKDPVDYHNEAYK